MNKVKDWLNHPVTVRYKELLKEHRDAHINRMLNMGCLSPETLPELAQIKGQVNALDIMLNIDMTETFFEEEFRNDETRI